MAKPLERRVAKATVAAVEACLKDGIPIEGKPSAVSEAARRLGINRQTLRSRLETAEMLYGLKPKQTLVEQAAKPAKAEKVAKPAPAPKDHAQARARTLAREITTLITTTRFPVVNPGAVMVDSFMTRGYSRTEGDYVERESTPRTWLSDTLRVAPIKKATGRRFLFTGAQNDAPIHAGFWANLQAYAKHVDAEIIVGPWTYETQWWSENNPAARSYDPAIAEHLCFGQLAIGDSFVFCGEMNTLPTASRPVSDLVTYSRGRWAVFPHAKLQLKSVPSTDPGTQAHQVMTTGAVTVPKVIPRKAGVKSIFHHVIGATLVEFDVAGRPFCRQINADEEGSFYDLDRHVSAGAVTEGHRARAIVFPDLHHAKLGAASSRALFGVDAKNSYAHGSVLDTLKPELAFIHDGHDQEVANHHRAGDGHASYELAARGRVSVMQEVKSFGEFEVSLARPWLRIVNVESNHDIALDRYVKEGRYRNDGINLPFGLRLELAMVEHRKEVAEALDEGKAPPKFSLLEHALREMFGARLDHVEWAYDGTSKLVDGIECGHHGFRGANGAKGTVEGFARMGRKMSIGDKHSPEICDGVYVAGVCELQHGYNRGPSGWATTCIVQYQNGKRALVTLQADRWRA